MTQELRVGGDGASRVVARFWECVRKSEGCWEWTAQLNVSGYGRIWVNNKRKAAHRFSWELHYGGQIPPGLCVCHRCDNPKCVRPDHLFLGTHSENMVDCFRKGRGKAVGAYQISEATARSIRRMKTLGVSARQIAKELGVSGWTVADVVRGRTWKHVG